MVFFFIFVQNYLCDEFLVESLSVLYVNLGLGREQY